VFRRNYGVETELPGYYTIDAKIYPQDLNYVLRVQKYAAPNNSIYKIRTYEQTEDREGKLITKGGPL